MRRAAVLVAFVALPAHAQDRPFTGPVVGIEGGYLEHHFSLEFEQRDAADTLVARQSRYYRSHGVGGGVFGGYDWAISDRGRLGLELGATAGGDTNTADLGSFGSLSLKPRFGASAAVRAGYVLAPSAMVYAAAGYGGNAYRVRDTARLGNSAELEWGSSFLVGAGAEFRLADRIGLRVDGRHVDNQTWRVFVGVPIRF
ncbi:outer membrane protein [Sphingomonas aracearum]|uniref:Outer membrane protein beta-barrel domain-containing protein n=1 Tax=Sphingomonas aracearum TaxID=2283317 RepID=A0A369VZ53_9SPHN|nr:outer membrane beta-barrel protein [Sphingomonas aracearum]RDE06917.1 hypothetical protein DVW87_04410 [Sphingomonas aracearum]